MSDSNIINLNEIIKKRDLLTQASNNLKKEFFGIDSVIDQIIDSFSSWFFFPYIQDRPIVINLWGMTGVGKSRLIQKLINMLKLEEYYFSFDMSEVISHKSNMSRELISIHRSINDKPLILTFDEFQLARTVKESGEEVDRPESRLIWELIDSGQYKFVDYDYKYYHLFDFYHRISSLIRLGVKVKNGIVIQGKSIIKQELDVSEENPKEENLFFIPEREQSYICDLVPDRFNNITELRLQLSQLDLAETINLLKNILDDSLKPKNLNLSKSLIFIIGNLDEAYSMSGDFNPDIEADSFYEETKLIGVPKIKNALKRRFRKEQISRLGNTHIIYPSLDRQAFCRIISKELKK